MINPHATSRETGDCPTHPPKVSTVEVPHVRSESWQAVVPPQGALAAGGGVTPGSSAPVGQGGAV